MESGLDGPDRDTECGRDLGQRQVEVEVQDDDEALILVEPPEPASDLVTGDRGDRVVGLRWQVDLGELDLDDPTPVPPQLVVAGTDEQAVEPRLESIGVAEPWQIPPGADEGFLDGVLRPLGIADDEPGGRVHAPDRGACERFEGVMIAPLRPFHELTLHGGLDRTRARRSVALPSMAAPRRRQVPAISFLAGQRTTRTRPMRAESGPSDTIGQMFERTVLPAGPRVISARLPGARSVSIAAYVLAGSRLESPDQAGVAHFMEHLTFKGTADYPSSRAISEAIEGVGGSFNAATDRESTVYWVRVPRREAERAVDVLGELVVRPRLDDDDIEGERAVIVEEIRSYLDDPAEYAQILFQQAMFGDGPLGREICGDEPGIRKLPNATIRAFWEQAYRPANTIVAVAGDLDHPTAVALAAAAFGTGNGVVPGFDPAPALPAGPTVLTGRRDTTQAQLSLGVPALRRDHPQAWALAVLNAVLGDGMSSRLFLGVREEKGLAYDVSSGIVEYADTGALEVSAGVDPAKLPAAIEAILQELGRLRDDEVPPDELAKAKAYLGGGLELRMDDTRHLASWIGGQEALHDRVFTLDEALDAIAAVTASDIRALAAELFRDEALRMAVVAPARHVRGLERRLRLPA